MNMTAEDKSAYGRNPENLLGKAQYQAPDQIFEGTWDGTQQALNKIYEFIEKRYVEHLWNFMAELPFLVMPGKNRCCSFFTMALLFFSFSKKDDSTISFEFIHLAVL